MTGLLDPDRNCPHGHGKLVPADGLFGLPQMAYQPANALAATLSGNTGQNSGRVTGTGKVFTVRVFSCPVCGAIELVDSDKA